MQKLLGRYIAQRREELHLTQEELAKRLRLYGLERSSTSVAKWEAGGTVPVEILGIIAQALEEPSPIRLYELAGILDDVPGSEIVKMLYDVPTEDLRRIERLIRAYLQEGNEKERA